MVTTSALQAALPDYEISSELGRGAMGVVYLGRHRALDRPVAIKELPASFSADSSVRDRFLTEARTVAGLDHPHVVVIHDFVDRDGHLALVMEHLPNGTVWDQFLTHGLSAPRACGLALATLAGVHHAHQRGVMHRDIKPENLIFAHDWQLKVTDFGIAQVLTGNETMATAEGSIVGTPAYMSPEQAEGRVCGPQADVYGAGAMLYEMLTGVLPFPNAATAMEMATARLRVDPVPIGSAGQEVAPAIGAVVMRALARKEADRYATAEDFGVALGQAAALTWGPNWMSETGTAVRGSDAIEAAARTTGPHQHASPPSVEPTGPVDSPQPSPEAQASPVPEPVPVAPPPARPQPAPLPTAAVVAQPRGQQFAGANLADVAPQELLKLAEIRRPPSPMIPAVIATLAIAAALFFALTGLGADPVAGPQSQAAIAGVAVDEPAEVDLTAPFPVAGVGDGTVVATFLGIPVGSVSIQSGVLDPDYLRFTGAGVLEFTPAGGAEESFPVRATNNLYPTLPFVVAAIFALGGLGSVSSNLRAMRARRLRLSALGGLAISGAITGAAAAVLAMLVLLTAASIQTVIVSAVAAAIGSVALGEAYRRWHRRRRLKRVMVAVGRR